ncbi:MAG: SMC-Scp complex subunit ScpB [bacterium]|nr:SMC-Scp complex subunit ScpB [bacterium]
MAKQNYSNPNALKAAIEALLFVYGEPFEITRLAKTLGIEPDAAHGALDALAADYAADGRGLALVRTEKAVQLGTAAALSSLIEDFVKEEFAEGLTPASLETLAIVMYTGPISRAEIEYIRGVNSTFMLRSLLLRGLITRESDSKRMNAYLYEASFDLLRQLGVTSTNDLPEAQKYRALIEAFRNPPAVGSPQESPTPAPIEPAP